MTDRIYRAITPTDVDRFIQIPDNIEVDARGVVLTVEEDTLSKYDNVFRIQDYAIFCEIPKNRFFNFSAMDWKYKIIQEIDSSGNYLGPKAIDAHNPTVMNPVPLVNDIILSTDAKEYLGITTETTRFSHYRQANKFFKYSFKIDHDPLMYTPLNADNTPKYLDASGAPVQMPMQLYAVYLDKTTGEPLPYWRTVAGNGLDQSDEVKQFFYADRSILQDDLTDASGGYAMQIINNGQWTYRSSQEITVVSPPDPEFLETSADGTVVGGNLSFTADVSGVLAIRAVGDEDPSGNPRIVYTMDNFVKYSEEPNRALMLYWIVDPLPGKLYMGHDMYIAWCSEAIGNTAGMLRPIRDFVDASGNRLPIPANLLEVHKFTVGFDILARRVYSVGDPVIRAVRDGSNLGQAPKLYLPASRFITIHDSPHEPDVAQGEFDIPFAYEVANKTDFDDTRKSIVGGRVMQMLSHYLFDAATNRELAYFPYLLNESKSLNDKIIDALSALLKDTSSAVSGSRSNILHQIMVKYGKKYFEEAAALNNVNNERLGSVKDVLRRIDELFLHWTVTVRTTVSNRTKDKVDILRLVEVPVVCRVFPPPPPPVAPRWLAGVEGTNATLASKDGTATYMLAYNDYDSWEGWPTAIYEPGNSVSLDVQPGTLNYPQQFNIVKLAQDNGAAQWIVQIGANNMRVDTMKITEDSLGNVVVSMTTIFSDISSIEILHSSGVRSTVTYANAIGGDIVMRFTPAGSYIDTVCIRNVGTGWNNRYIGVCFDASNNMYVTGSYDRYVGAMTPVITNSDGQPASLPAIAAAPGSAPRYLQYLAKFTNGVGQWVLTTTMNRNFAPPVTDSAGNVYVAGYYMKNMVGSGLGEAGGQYSQTVSLIDIFTATEGSTEFGVGVAKYSPQGVPQWIAGLNSVDVQDVDVGMAIGANDELFVSDQIRGWSGSVTVNVFNSDGSQTVTLPDAQNNDGALYVVKFDTSTGNASWGLLIDFYSYNSIWQPSLLFDGNNNLVITGAYIGDWANLALYTPGSTNPAYTFPSRPPANSAAVFVTKFNSTSGTLVGGEVIFSAGETVIRGASSNGQYVFVNIDFDKSWNQPTAPTSVTFYDANGSTMTLDKPPTSRVLIKTYTAAI